MRRLRSEIDQAHLFLQLVREKRDPRSILREALSNSYDARATCVKIHIRRTSSRDLDLVVSDNGKGMTLDGLRRFFGLGLSMKSKVHGHQIGEKGLGAKLFFDSRKVRIRTRTGRRGLLAELIDPIASLEAGRLPQYTVEVDSDPLLSSGTEIHVLGLKHAMPASLLDHKALQYYLAWFTIAGSAAHLFGRGSPPLKVRLVTEDTFGTEQSTTVWGHELPSGPSDEDYEEPDPALFAQQFSPFELTLIDAKGAPSAKLEVVGAIVGANAHVVKERHLKKQFKGFFLSKDYFAVRNVSQEVTRGTGEWQSFHVIANCSELELAANREDFRDTGPSSTYSMAIEALQQFFGATKSGSPFCYRGQRVEASARAEAGYVGLQKRKARHKAAAQAQKLSLQMLKASSLQIAASGEMLEPLDEFGTALVLQRALLGQPSLAGLAGHQLLGALSVRPTLVALANPPKGSSCVALVVHTLSPAHIDEARAIGADRVICWKVGMAQGPDHLPTVVELSKVLLRR